MHELAAHPEVCRSVQASQPTTLHRRHRRESSHHLNSQRAHLHSGHALRTPCRSAVMSSMLMFARTYAHCPATSQAGSTGKLFSVLFCVRSLVHCPRAYLVNAISKLRRSFEQAVKHISTHVANLLRLQRSIE